MKQGQRNMVICARLRPAVISFQYYRFESDGTTICTDSTGINSAITTGSCTLEERNDGRNS